jgi:hypothetical protein
MWRMTKRLDITDLEKRYKVVVVDDDGLER